MSSIYDKAVRAGLTRQQIKDCFDAGRSPASGRLLRSSPPTVAEVSARKMNWRKLLIKGAIGQLRHIASTVGLWAELSPTLDQLETQLLAGSEALHQKIKARAMSK